MKKLTIMLALAIVAGASCSTAFAKGKKDKKQAEAPVVEQKQIVQLQSESDSVSYAAGQTFTDGMLPYVISQLQVDTTYMADFIDGLRASLNAEDTPQAKAKAAGQQIAQMFMSRMLPDVKRQMEGTGIVISDDLIKRGFIDAVEKDASVLSVAEASSYFMAKSKAIQEKKVEEQKAAGKAWLEENAKKEGVITLPSGLQYKVITAGNGPVADKSDDVVVKYEGKLLDGTIFDSSYQRNPQTTTFKPSQVIAGWTEALCMMPQGSTWELYIPENLAYGERPAGKIPAYSTLIFKVEVVEVKKEAPKAETEEAKPAVKKPAVKKPAAKKPVAKK